MSGFVFSGDGPDRAGNDSREEMVYAFQKGERLILSDEASLDAAQVSGRWMSMETGPEVTDR